MQLGRSLTLCWRDVAMVRVAMTVALALLLGAVTPAQAAGLDRARGQGKMILGYRADARPFSYKDDAGKAAGYSVALCQKIVDAAKAELSLPKVDVEFVEVTSADRFEALEQGRIDLLCGAATATLERRRQVAFSIPIFPSGISALVREGSGTAAALSGIEVAGKTGTAEIDIARGINTPWFIGFAPRDNPRIAIAVAIERAQGQGGVVAAPIAKQVLEELLG